MNITVTSVQATGLRLGEVLITCEWKSQDLCHSPFTFPAPLLLMPRSLFCLFSDSEVQGMAGSQEAHLGTAPKNPQARPSRSSLVFPNDGTPASLWHPALGQAALITQWVLVDDMSLVCITRLHWCRHPGHHLSESWGPGLRERNPEVWATFRIWIFPVLSLSPSLQAHTVSLPGASWTKAGEES